MQPSLLLIRLPVLTNQIIHIVVVIKRLFFGNKRNTIQPITKLQE